MAANEYNISAGLVPIDNSTGATANSYYISAGLVPTDTAAGGETYTWSGSGSFRESGATTRHLSAGRTTAGAI